MENKPAVTALQEFCFKSGKSMPIYTFILSEDRGFVCKVTAVQTESYGNGRNKRIAKEMAAENMWRKLSAKSEDGKEIEEISEILIENKPAVTALQEFCSKSGKSMPIYNFTLDEDGGYVCKVTAVQTESSGNGRSKRQAKQMAAENIWRILSEKAEVGKEIEVINRDMVKELRDYCSLHGMPPPIIRDAQQNGSCSDQEFVVACSVGGIVRCGKSDKKKYARQQAAIKLLDFISKKMADDDGEIIKAFEDITLENKKKFNTYKDLTDTGRVNNDCVPLCDRHNYFKKFCPALKEAAFEVIRSDNYPSTKDKAMSLMSALKLTPIIGTVDSNSVEPLLKIDLNCEFDCLFLGMQSEIYARIIEYFKDMLV